MLDLHPTACTLHRLDAAVAVDPATGFATTPTRSQIDALLSVRELSSRELRRLPEGMREAEVIGIQSMRGVVLQLDDRVEVLEGPHAGRWVLHKVDDNSNTWVLPHWLGYAVKEGAP